MNYEEFSPEARNAIDQFRNFIEEIKIGKINFKAVYCHRLNNYFTIQLKYLNDQSLLLCGIYAYCYCITGKIYDSSTRGEIMSFIESKNYFFPTFTSKEDFEQNKHKYSFIG